MARSDNVSFCNNQKLFLETARSYYGYNLSFSSTIPLPYLTEKEHCHDNYDVYIKSGTIFGSEYQPPMTPKVTCCSQKKLLLAGPSNTMLVTEGGHITVELNPVPIENMMRLKQKLMTWALGGLFLQRGTIALHGCAICLGDSAFVLCAPSGYGKSTITTAFLNKGYFFLDDNIAVVHGKKETFYIASGSPEIKLYRDYINIINPTFDYNIVNNAESKVDKLSLIACSRFRHESTKLSTIFILKRGAKEKIYFRHLTGAAKVEAIIKNIFCVSFLKEAIFHHMVFGRIHEMANFIPIIEVTLPDPLPPPNVICEKILNSLTNKEYRTA